ncbi:MAG TPA: 3-hydroxyacyl-CoA dehydrogenase family protein, partial [Nonomuraea sp.]|nr:3-hydroxyacyl-CoA dehydrogenase family protein [Nonomuraea sp.]
MNVGVIGGGRMGSGIAQVFLARGDRVTVQEPQARTARERIAEGLAVAAAKGLADRADALARLTMGPVPADADLVIEAVPEDPALKAEVLAEAESRIRQDAVLATNTSSLSIAELAAALDRPERLIGLHFFNPVPVQRLVEIVVTKATPAPLLALARRYVDRLGKTSVVINDSPGFATSRLGVLLGLEAIR